MLGEFQIIFLYLLVLILLFSFVALLRIHLDIGEKRKSNNSSEDKSLEILDEVSIRDSGCDVDKVIRDLEREDIDMYSKYTF